jgi:hypothetical protein
MTTDATRRPSRSRGFLAVLAALVAMWLGLTAPSVSPVAPSAPPAVVDQAAQTPVGGAAQTPVGGAAQTPVGAAVPTPTVTQTVVVPAPAGQRDPRGPGGRR